ncbi:MAG TPA: ABC transporter permease [Phycisphaerae bacterium]|nr:ABC transporter permease [Phycisphaerae bacterium]
MRETFEMFGDLGYMLLDAAAGIKPALLSGRGTRQGWHNLWTQMNRIGVESIPIVCLVMSCIGAILALQLGPQFARFGFVPYTADAVALATFREMGPLVAAVVLTGFGGAAIAAEIGTMVVGEEIEAMYALSINPIRFLVTPRILASMIMMVCLTATADIAAVFGGMLVSSLSLHIRTLQYIHHTVSSLSVGDFVSGLIKGAVFGLLIGAIACFLGLRVTGGAEGVGINTSKTVVMTIVALIVVDLLFTTVFFYLGF